MERVLAIIENFIRKEIGPESWPEPIDGSHPQSLHHQVDGPDLRGEHPLPDECGHVVGNGPRDNQQDPEKPPETHLLHIKDQGHGQPQRDMEHDVGDGPENGEAQSVVEARLGGGTGKEDVAEVLKPHELIVHVEETEAHAHDERHQHQHGHAEHGRGDVGIDTWQRDQPLE